MDAKDVDVYLEARKQIQRNRFLTVVSLSLLCVGLGLVLMVERFDNQYGAGIVTGCLVGAFMALLGEARGAKDKLLSLVESQINKDSKALRHLAKRSESQLQGLQDAD